MYFPNKIIPSIDSTISIKSCTQKNRGIGNTLHPIKISNEGENPSSSLAPNPNSEEMRVIYTTMETQKKGFHIHIQPIHPMNITQYQFNHKTINVKTQRLHTKAMEEKGTWGFFLCLPRAWVSSYEPPKIPWQYIKKSYASLQEYTPILCLPQEINTLLSLPHSYASLKIIAR